MPRYIDADALNAYIESNACNSVGKALQAIDNAPTVSPDDVRGVVHCGECKFWRRPPSCEGLARCETGETGIRYRSKNDFCSRGAKMEVTDDVRGVGTWLRKEKVRHNLDGDGDYRYECSACGHSDEHNENVHVPFCWYCGAKMEVSEDA